MQDERLMCQHQMNEPNSQRTILIQDNKAATSLTSHSSPVPLVKKLSWAERAKPGVKKGTFSTATDVIHWGINVTHLMSLLSRTSNHERLR